LVPTHSSDTRFRRLIVNQFIAQPLVIALVMIMGDKLRDSPPMMPLAEQNQATETFLFDERTNRSA
jgi:hypothetical protein